MKKIKTKFKDLFIVNTRVYKDKRGWLKEEFKKNFIKKNLVFTLVSSSKKNVLRGLHMQTKKSQDKFLSVLKGRVIDVAVDLRKNSKTFGKYYSLIISDKSEYSFYVPEGFAHGFCTLTDNVILLYKSSKYRHSKSETGIKWNDKDLKIKWPTKRMIISQKDKKNISFKDFQRLI